MGICTGDLVAMKQPLDVSRGAFWNISDQAKEASFADGYLKIL